MTSKCERHNDAFPQMVRADGDETSSGVTQRAVNYRLKVLYHDVVNCREVLVSSDVSLVDVELPNDEG